MRREAGSDCDALIVTPRTQVGDWPELQQCIEETLKYRLLTLQESVRTEEEADYLADHVADDLVGKFLITKR